jgi:hypothetical protein
MPLAMSTLPSGPRAVDFVELQATPNRPRATAVKTSLEVLMIPLRNHPAKASTRQARTDHLGPFTAGLAGAAKMTV